MLKIFILITLLIACSCDNRSYLEIVNGAKYKVGQTIHLTRGFYRGCSMKVEKLNISRNGLEYLCSSSCAEKGHLIGIRESYLVKGE